MVKTSATPRELDVLIQFLQTIAEADEIPLGEVRVDLAGEEVEFYTAETKGIMWCRLLQRADVISIEEGADQLVRQSDQAKFVGFLSSFQNALEDLIERAERGEPHHGYWDLDLSLTNPVTEFYLSEHIYLTREKVHTEEKTGGSKYYYLDLSDPELIYLDLGIGDTLRLERVPLAPERHGEGPAESDSASRFYIAATKVGEKRTSRSTKEAYREIYHKPRTAPNPRITIPKMWCSTFFGGDDPGSGDGEPNMLFVEINQPERELRIYRMQDYETYRLPEIQKQPYPFHDFTDVFKRSGIKIRQKVILGNDYKFDE